MRVAFFLPFFPHAYEPYVLDEIAGFLDAGHSVDTYSLRRAKSALRTHPALEKYNLLDNVRYLRLAPHRLARRIDSLRYLGLLALHRPRAAAAILRVQTTQRLRLHLAVFGQFRQTWGSRNRYDVVYCQPGWMALFTPTVAGASSSKLVVTFHGRDAFGFQGGMFPFEPNPTSLYKGVFEAADACVALSGYGRSRLLEIGCPEHKIASVPNAVDLDFFTYRPRQRLSGEAVRILSIGRLGLETKGIEYALRATAKVSRQHDVHYTLIGSERGKEAYDQTQRLVEQLELQQVVRLVDSVDRAGVKRLLDEAHLFVLPSVTDSIGAQDWAPNVLREAAASGLPIVATRTGGIPEVVEEGASGFLVPEKDADALAGALAHLIDRASEWPQFGARGRQIVQERYDLRHRQASLVSLFEALLQNPSSQVRSG